MPYIKKEQRARLDPIITELIFALNWLDEGAVNYIITKVIDGLYGSEGYALMNKAMGILECVKQEFYRRRMAPYEDKKKEENGDVY